MISIFNQNIQKIECVNSSGSLKINLELIIDFNPNRESEN
ncbi:hypothetical protein LEP1GSC060_3757 [Leptospira weilii serovar Ranarum str. ICFT]|uniref:Uncharacterized protein n=1 Tax=Leptospira weilii serovar Ranarum str. ICFT TaxID=1218598 RepID=N1WN29_9LEPT|nr:hypothetical protein LEP1GSC060_3757 [Leptospira weilii serovar Ranarum str. ICFT]